MSAPVVNQAYSQQVNQAFDLFKTFTPQQMQQMGQQVAQKPNSPEAVAFAGAAQYQQQMRAPQPQAPQGTIFQQKLQEFQQTSPQGLPSVGGNQMAMQQAAQQDPMRNAGIGAAPENMPAPQPQGQAATGGLVALAHGGEVRHFEEGGDTTLDPLAGLNDPNAQPEDSFYNNIAEYGKKGLIGGFKNVSRQYKQGFNNLYEDVKDLGTDVLYGSEGPPKESLPTPVPEIKVKNKDKITDHQGMAGLKKSLSKGEVNPNSYDADAAVAPMLNSETMPKYSEEPVGKHDILFAPADTSSAARNQASPTAYQTLEDIMKFRGEEADMSEEVAMAKEAARGANKDKWGTALAQGIGGMLSAQTPYMGQALGAGLMSGVSGYQQGAKEEQAANKDLMALQMASKKSKLQGHREAADIILAEKAAIKAAQAATYNKMTQAQYEESLRRGTKGIEHGYNKELESGKQVAALHNNIVMEMIKSKITPYESQKSYIALATSMDPTGMLAASNPEKFKAMLDKAYQNLPGNTGSGLGNIGGGQPSGQPLGNNISMSTPTQ